MKHILLRNPRLNGWEYGMLRALEAEVIRQTSAEIVNIPDYGWKPVLKKVGHGMRLDKMRNKLPKKKFAPQADVLWCILMAPEDCDLDLFTGWEQIPNRIVYLFDTLEPQFPVLKRLFTGNTFTTRVTSFNDAVEPLQHLTGNSWHAVEQAVPDELFHGGSIDQRLIHFSSYGRRFPAFHEALLDFCSANGLYYDFTTHDARHPTAPANQLYQQYSWHLSHSLFTVSWPVELTNPVRAGKLHPVTCRWFEAAAAGTILLGRAPGNPIFGDYLFKDAVVEIDPLTSKEIIYKQLDSIWARREELFRYAQQMQAAHRHRLTWTNRVQRMLRIWQEQKNLTPQ